MVEKDLGVYLAQLRRFPFVREVELLPAAARDGNAPDGRLILHTPSGRIQYDLEVKQTTPIGRAIVDRLADRAHQAPRRVLLLAPYVSAPMAAYLRERGIDFLDAAGNCHLNPGPRMVVWIEGRRPAEVPTRRRGTAEPQVLFSLLASPDLLSATVRDIAQASGTSKSAAARAVARLAEDGLLVESRARRFLDRRKEALDRWLAVYASEVRPRWLQGRYQAAPRPLDELESAIAGALAGSTWAWGGAAAAIRLFEYYRGPDTVVHVARPARELARTIRALPAKDGPITVLVTPVPVAFQGLREHTVHPLLIYTELATSDDERARNTALEIRERFLERAA